MSIFTKAFAWLKKAFSFAQKEAAPVVVSVLEAVKAGEDDGILPAIASVLDHATNGLSVTINDELKKDTVKVISVALALEVPTDMSDAAAIEKWEASVIQAWTQKTALGIKGQVITTLGAQLYALFAPVFEPGGTGITFAVIADKIEQAYQDYLADVTAANADNQN